MEKDCKVCQQLIKEKNRNMIWWKVFCLIFATLSLVLGILYFSSGAVVKEKHIEIYENEFTNNGDNGNIIIGSDNNNVGGTIEGVVKETDFTPIICITVIVGIATIVVGGVLIANYVKRND